MQTIRSVVLELQPESVIQLRAQLKRMTDAQHTQAEAYSAIKAAIPLLHFMSVTIFPDDQYDPILVIEVNFDGPPGPFWAEFERAFQDDLRAMLRCGKAPRDGRGPLFLAVTRDGARAPIAPLLEALSVIPAVGHQGNRGLGRAQIDTEGRLFATAQDVIDAGGVNAQTTAVGIHTALRAAVPPALLAPPAERFPAAEMRADVARLAGFVAIVLFAAMMPGVFASLLMPPILSGVLLIGAGVAFYRRLGLELSSAMIGALPKIVGALLLFAALLSLGFAVPGSIHHWRIERYWSHVARCFMHLGLGALGLFPVVAGVLLWVRWLESRDSSQDAPPRDEAMLRAMARREDKITQNHMGSVVHIKPGILRAVLLPLALRGLGLYLRVAARNGYLATMRTIHFAHWAIISNGARLMFFSNFDGSWESYLDDFIEKAHPGLTLAWSGGIGFPPTRFLIGDGATQGRKFKAWARHSMAESLFWYSAYNGFTVNQIERQARVASGLRRSALTPKEAVEWARDL